MAKGVEKLGNDFHWLKLNIDSFLISDIGLYGSEVEKWRYIYLCMKYLKSECVLSYKSAVKLIGKETIDYFIDDIMCVHLYGQEAKREDKCIKIWECENNWNDFIKHRKNSRKGGLTTQANKRKKKAEEEQKQRISTHSEMSKEEIEMEVNKQQSDHELPF